MEVNILSELQSIRQLLERQNLLQKEVMTLNDACEYLSVSASYLYKLTCTDQIPHYIPTGKKIYLKRSEIDEWILRNRQFTNAEIEEAAEQYIAYGKKRGQS
jgi:excisionase family DNA binding protein